MSDITNPNDTAVTDPAVQQTQETPEKTNVQKRIDELTAEKYAAQKLAEQQSEQIAQLTQLVAQQTQQRQVERPATEQLPEGVDPAMAGFFQTQLKKMQDEMKMQIGNLHWQMQNQIDQQQVASKYSNLPPEVMADAANRFTALKNRFGAQNVTMDDAVGLAHFEWQKKQWANGRAQQYNGIGQPLTTQSAPAIQQQSSPMVSPASRPDWDSLPQEVQWKLLDDFEKKGGKIGIV